MTTAPWYLGSLEGGGRLPPQLVSLPATHLRRRWVSQFSLREQLYGDSLTHSRATAQRLSGTKGPIVDS
jgi:hypothetical protein